MNENLFYRIVVLIFLLFTWHILLIPSIIVWIITKRNYGWEIIKWVINGDEIK